jgi:DNA-binding CsgD family transcriptional regulator
MFEAGMGHAREALAIAEEAGDDAVAAHALCGLGLGEGYVHPPTGQPKLFRAVDLARAAGDGEALATAFRFLAFTYLFQDDHANVVRYAAEASAFEATLGEATSIGSRVLAVGSVHLLDGRLAEARAMFDEGRAAAGEAAAERVEMLWIDAQVGLLELLSGQPELALEHLETRLQRAIEVGAGMAIPGFLTWASWAEVAAGRVDEAHRRLDATLAIVDGRDCLLSVWCHWLRGEALRLAGDDGAAIAAAQRAREVGQASGNRLGETRGDMTLARLAAARGDWSAAEKHALAHLDAIDEGGHATFVPHCLDALAEVAAGLESYEEAVRLFAAADSARREIGITRWTREEDHWTAIEGRLRDALGADGFTAAWAAGSELSMREAVGWARRARGSRKRPQAGWESLTPTEAQVVELVADGLTNPQIAERMFISRATVKVHVAHIFRKLGVANRTELAARAVQRQH